MNKKLGVITIGQSPREDVLSEMRPLWGSDVEIVQAGALDGLGEEDVARFVPRKDDIVLVSRLNDGSTVKFGESYILPLLQRCIDTQEHAEPTLILFICTGRFPASFSSKTMLLYPQTILQAFVSAIAGGGRVGIMNPDEDQLGQCLQIWGKSAIAVEAVAASPYGDTKGIEEAAATLKKKEVSLVAMDCIGYSMQMKAMVEEITGKPVILARTLVARTIKELLGDGPAKGKA